jgi:hypothetical protein
MQTGTQYQLGGIGTDTGQGCLAVKKIDQYTGWSAQQLGLWFPYKDKEGFYFVSL